MRLNGLVDRWRPATGGKLQQAAPAHRGVVRVFFGFSVRSASGLVPNTFGPARTKVAQWRITLIPPMRALEQCNDLQKKKLLGTNAGRSVFYVVAEARGLCQADTAPVHLVLLRLRFARVWVLPEKGARDSPLGCSPSPSSRIDFRRLRVTILCSVRRSSRATLSMASVVVSIFDGPFNKQIVSLAEQCNYGFELQSRTPSLLV